MIALADVSVVVSVLVESADRLRNLRLLLDYLQRGFADAEIVIVEQDLTSRLQDVVGCRTGLLHEFIRSRDCHWKTRNLNHGARLASRSILWMLDSDVIHPPEAVRQGVELVRSGTPFVAPFNGVLVDIRRHMLENGADPVELMRDPPFFPPDYDLHPDRYDFRDMRPLYGGSRYRATGGSLLCDRRAFFRIGGWNSNFVSFGFEDMEMHHRIGRLAGGPLRLEAWNAYHMEHQRARDSLYNNFYRMNEAEYLRVCAMEPVELAEYASRGFRRVRLDAARVPVWANTEDEYHVGMRDSGLPDLGRLSLVLGIGSTAPPDTAQSLNALLDRLETEFNDYELIVVETGSRRFKYLRNKKNYRYRWYPEPAAEMSVALRDAVDDLGRPLVFAAVASPDSLARLAGLLDRAAAGHPPEDLFPDHARALAALVEQG